MRVPRGVATTEVMFEMASAVGLKMVTRASWQTSADMSAFRREVGKCDDAGEREGGAAAATAAAAAAAMGGEPPSANGLSPPSPRMASSASAAPNRRG